MKSTSSPATPRASRPAAPLPAYEVIYSRRKTIGLLVERDGRLVVHAPFGAGEERIAQIVRSKSLWIYAKTHRTPKFAAQPVRKELLTGETMPYLGRNYRLDILARNEQHPDGLSFNGHFQLRGATIETANEWFRAWYGARGGEWIPRRARSFMSSLGAHPRGITVSDVSASWGSCSPGGVLNFNWRLMKAPPGVVDYIIVHELAHLLEPNHTPRFWNIIAVQLPDYKASREWLVKYGAELEREF